MKQSFRLVGSALVLTCLVLLTSGIARAELKATSVVYAWDQVADKFQNSNIVVAFDGSWVSFLHQLNFDRYVYPTEHPNPLVTEACPGGGATQWAGQMEYGLYHTDDAPLGAPGFQESRAWQLVSCDRDGDGDFDNADLNYPPQTAITPYEGGTFVVLSRDVAVPCTTGNCFDEIVTTMFVNIDSDCDGTPNTDIPAGGLCFYAEARTPLTGDPFWAGPLQARISAGGGDKTVNFAPQPAPTAVTLSAFTATPQADVVLLEWETALELECLGFDLYRAGSPDGERVQLNPTRIACEALGGLWGTHYSFVDENVSVGETYFYWLEDISIDGTTLYGPLSAQIPYRVYVPVVQKE
ncbi:MAG: hypothetical protein JXD18_12445 [Anaerolineae bacterium]|nr:hypothetical protein [Anaerolineae bacterium]